MIDHPDDTCSNGVIPCLDKRRFFNIAILLRVDGFFSFAFGLATVFFQSAIISTIVDLKTAGGTGRGGSLMEAALRYRLHA
jgi:hypothetical protein